MVAQIYNRIIMMIFNKYLVLAFLLGALVALILMCQINTKENLPLSFFDLGRNEKIDLDELYEVKRAIEEDYVDSTAFDEPNIEKLAIQGLLSGLNDPYTRYVYTDYERHIDLLDGFTSGIGVYIKSYGSGDPQYVPQFLGGFLITEVVKNGPADQSGILAGDVIVEIDNSSTDGLRIDQVSDKIRGEVGSKVELTLLRFNETVVLPATLITLKFDVYRDNVYFPTIQLQFIDEKTAILTISRFTDRTYSELEQISSGLDFLSLDGLILDLRNNSGGYVNTAKSLTGAFIGDKIVFYQKSRDKELEPVFSDKNDIISEKINMVVIVNGNTASAAEMLAGALQFHGRAILVGSPTYGKGAITTLKKLSPETGLYITSSLWFTPGKISVSPDGLTPDKSLNFNSNNENHYIDTAVKLLRNP